jgi:hypothetical protein
MKKQHSSSDWRRREVVQAAAIAAGYAPLAAGASPSEVSDAVVRQPTRSPQEIRTRPTFWSAP